MADTIERLEVLIEANTRSYENAMKRLQQQTAAAFKASTASVKELDRSMGILGETAKLAMKSFGLGLGLEGLVKAGELIRETVKDAAELVDVSASLGITTDAMQALGYAARVTNTDFDALKSGLSIFNKNLGEASQGQGELFKVLKANHVALSGDLMTDLRNFANLVQNAGNQEQRARLETLAFGKAGGDLNELFTTGAAGLEAFTAKAKDAGAIIDGHLLEQTSELDKRWNDFADRLNNKVRAAILGVVGALDDLAAAAQGPARTAAHGSIGTQSGALIDAPTRGSANRFDDAGPAPLAAGAANRFDNAGAPRTVLPVVEDPKIAAQEKRYKDLAAAIGLETKNLTASSREQMINNEVAKLGSDATPEQIANIRKKAAALYDQGKALEDNRQAADMLATSMYDALSGIADGSLTATDALKKLVQQIIAAVLQAELLGTGPLAGLLGTAPTTAGAPAGLLGTLASAVVGSLPHFASGGTLGAGKVGLVGERGPELIRGPATITPNGGGGAMTLNVIVNGARGNAEIRTMAAQGASAAIAEYDKRQNRSRMLAA